MTVIGVTGVVYKSTISTATLSLSIFTYTDRGCSKILHMRFVHLNYFHKKLDDIDMII